MGKKYIYKKKKRNLKQKYNQRYELDKLVNKETEGKNMINKINIKRNTSK